jgi:hypothetical protein
MANAAAMRWEYNTVIFEPRWFVSGRLDGERFQTKLDELGRAGWELVSVFDTNVHEGATAQVVAVFKRPLP